MNQPIVAALGDVTAIRFDALCASLNGTAPDVVHRAVLELARYDIVTIQQ